MIKLSIKLLVIAFLICSFQMLNFTKAMAAGCTVGSFNQINQSGGPSLVIYEDTQNSNPTAQLQDLKPGDVVRVFNDIDSNSDKQNIINNLSGKGVYLTVFNEPNLEGNRSPQEVAARIQEWYSLTRGTDIKLMFPAYAHGEGFWIQDVGEQQKELVRELKSAGVSNLCMAANIYTGTGNGNSTIGAFNTLVQEHKTIASQSGGVINNNCLIVTEAGVMTHQRVENNSCPVNIQNWLDVTANLMQQVSTGGATGINSAFFGYLGSSQIPMQYDCAGNFSATAQKGDNTSYSPNPNSSFAQNAANGTLPEGWVQSCQLDPTQQFQCTTVTLGASSTACATCAGVGEVIDDRNWARRLADSARATIRNLTGGLEQFTFAVDNKTAVTWPNANDPNTNEIGGADESLWNNLVPGLNENLSITEAYEQSSKQNEAGAPRVPNALVVFAPEQAKKIENSLSKIKDENNRYTRKTVCYNAPGSVQSSSGCIELQADGSTQNLAALAGATANLWAVPGAPLSQVSPIGLTDTEYLGQAQAEKKQAYLDSARKKFLSQNLSNQEYADYVFKVQENNDKNFAAKYVFNESTKVQEQQNNTNTTDKNPIQKTFLGLPSFGNSACILPQQAPFTTTCIRPQQNEITITVKDNNYECTGEKDPATGSVDENCDNKSHDVELAILQDYLTGTNVIDPTGINDETVTSKALITQAMSSKIASLSDNNIQLTANSPAGSNQFSIGAQESLGTWALMVLPPGKTSNKNAVSSAYEVNNVSTEFTAENLSASNSTEVPLDANVVSKNTGKDTINVTGGIVTPKGTSEAYCSPRLTYMLGAIPQKLLQLTPSIKTETEKKMQDYLGQNCFGKVLPPEESMCSSQSVVVNNNTPSYFDLRDPREQNALSGIGSSSNFLDNDSDLKIKIAHRYVDGAVLITSDGKDIVPVNPGTGSCKNKGVSGPQIYYLPLGFDPTDNDNWKNHASRLSIVIPNKKYTHAEVELNVKPGFYKVQSRGDPTCIHENVNVNMPEYFTLQSPSENVCVNITKNPVMEGGNGGDEYEDSVDSCNLSSSYNLKWNNACGGGRGNDPEDPGKWGDLATKHPLGKEAYKLIFGRDFKNSEDEDDGECAKLFPSTTTKVSCSDANNSDIYNTNSLSQFTNQDPKVGQITNLPVNNLTAGFYAPETIFNIYQTLNQDIKNKVEACQASNNNNPCGMVAFRKEDIGQSMCVQVPGKEKLKVVVVAQNNSYNRQITLDQSTYLQLGGSTNSSSISGLSLVSCN